ncbi:hypothetical protein SSS_08055 [Sarcoptes scabiei]|nr:hypothetical protein SSS_08055 [Sarcoptes scabiei]
MFTKNTLLLAIVLALIRNSSAIQGWTDFIWGTQTNISNDSIQTTNNDPTIKLNFVGANKSLVDTFSTLEKIDDSNLLNQIRFNPGDIEFIVPNQPKNLGDKIVEQIREQLGNQPITLGELKNRNLSFTLEMPGVQFNRTVQTEINEDTVIQRRNNGNEFKRMSPKSYVVQSYMDSLPKPSMLTQPIAFVPDPRAQSYAAPLSNVYQPPSPEKKIALPATLSTPTVNVTFQQPNTRTYLATATISPKPIMAMPYVIATNTIKPNDSSSYNSISISNQTSPTLINSTQAVPIVPVQITNSPAKGLISGEGTIYKMLSSAPSSNYSMPANVQLQQSTQNIVPPKSESSITPAEVLPQPVPVVSYQPMQSIPTPLLPAPQINSKPTVYLAPPPPLLAPKADYSAYLNQASSTQPMPAQKPQIVYRYIEICNGRAENPMNDMHSNLNPNYQTVQNGLTKNYNLQDQLENSLMQLEQLKMLVAYYQSLVPALKEYGEKQLDVAANIMANPLQSIQRPLFGGVPKPESPIPQSDIYYRSPEISKTIYDGGNIKVSYESVEETFKTDAGIKPISSAPIIY